MQGDAVLLSDGTEENEVFINENYSEERNKKACIRNLLS
jgi:hypothetical protein